MAGLRPTIECASIEEGMGRATMMLFENALKLLLSNPETGTDYYIRGTYTRYNLDFYNLMSSICTMQGSEGCP